MHSTKVRGAEFPGRDGLNRPVAASSQFCATSSPSSSSSLPLTLCWKTATHPLVAWPQRPAPTEVVSPPTTTETGETCGTKIRLRLESAATECEPEPCGTVSISCLDLASITPSTAACWLAVAQLPPGGGNTLQFRL